MTHSVCINRHTNACYQRTEVCVGIQLFCSSSHLFKLTRKKIIARHCLFHRKCEHEHVSIGLHGSVWTDNNWWQFNQLYLLPKTNPKATLETIFCKGRAIAMVLPESLRSTDVRFSTSVSILSSMDVLPTPKSRRACRANLRHSLQLSPYWLKIIPDWWGNEKNC